MLWHMCRASAPSAHWRAICGAVACIGKLLTAINAQICSRRLVANQMAYRLKHKARRVAVRNRKAGATSSRRIIGVPRTLFCAHIALRRLLGILSPRAHLRRASKHALAHSLWRAHQAARHADALLRRTRRRAAARMAGGKQWHCIIFCTHFAPPHARCTSAHIDNASKRAQTHHMRDLPARAYAAPLHARQHAAMHRDTRTASTCRRLHTAASSGCVR